LHPSSLTAGDLMTCVLQEAFHPAGFQT